MSIILFVFAITFCLFTEGAIRAQSPLIKSSQKRVPAYLLLAVASVFFIYESVVATEYVITTLSRYRMGI